MVEETEAAPILRAQFERSAPAEVQTLPLLSSTPPPVAQALLRAYPYLLIANKALLVATWTNAEPWLNLSLMCAYAFCVTYFELIVTWAGHVLVALAVVAYAVLNRHISGETARRPALDDVVHALGTTCAKADLLLSPVTQMALTPYDIKRLVFTTVFLTPVYVAATLLVVAPRTLVLVLGLYAMAYHLAALRVVRLVLWRVRLTRVLVFYLTGLDLLRARHRLVFAAAFAKVHKSVGAARSQPARFTYVVYENQRRWLGIGWTANLLTYERAPWTDEFLNELQAVDAFELPAVPQDSPELAAAHWRWVDKAWRLDLTHDGAISLAPGRRSKTTANPAPEDGFIYYDNVWKKPATEDLFSKYTRRRRWIRTAELVFLDDPKSPKADVDSIPERDADGKSESAKSLRFEETKKDV